MPAELIVKARCSVSNGAFAISLTRAHVGHWAAGRTWRIPNKQAGTLTGACTVDGLYITPDYQGCPYCRNTEVFLCSVCRALRCQGSARDFRGTRVVHCAQCGTSARLEGYIETLDAGTDL